MRILLIGGTGFIGPFVVDALARSGHDIAVFHRGTNMSEHGINDALATTTRTGPGGQRGNDSESSATGSHPRTSSSDKPLPGPVTANPRTPLTAAS